MSSTSFINGTVIQPSWLNDVNSLVYSGQDFTGSVPINVKTFPYLAKGDGVTDDTTAIQAAVTACAIGGTIFIPDGRYKLTSAIRLTQPITIRGNGTGSPYNDLGSYILQSNNAANGFTMVASLANFAFSQYGCIGVHFMDLTIQGTSTASPALNGVGVDTTVNSGVFHIRDCSMTRVTIKYFTTGVNFTGIAYLNRFFDCVIARCTTGYKIAVGSSGSAGGQTRWFGCNVDLNTTGLSLNEDSPGGDFYISGCTIADGVDGIRCNDDAQLTVIGSHFETLSGSGIYIPIPLAKANPSNGAPKTIIGNSFNANGQSIWFDKLATAFSNGLFNFPAFIDGNMFQDALALKVTVPAGQTPGWCSTNTVIGQTNAGTNNTQLATSQISSIFFGTDQRKRKYTRRYTFTGSYVSGTVLDSLPVGFVPTSVRMYLTANSSGFTSLQLGDSQSNSRYISGINAQTQTLNTWINASLAVPEFIVDSTSNNQQIALVGTAGILSAAGVIEVDGFLS